MIEHRNISLADQIFDQLEADILSGKYRRGDIVNEAGLAKELGVSRTPVREALGRLEQEQLVEESGRNITVIGISYEDMQDMYDIRLSIEPESSRRAAARISKEELEKMREVLDLQRFYVEKEGESNSIQIKNLDSEFHELLYKASGSKAYFETLRSLHKKMTKFRKASVSKKSRALQSYAEHEEIYKALSDHDTDKAEKTVMTHVRNARGRMNSLED